MMTWDSLLNTAMRLDKIGVVVERGRKRKARLNVHMGPHLDDFGSESRNTDNERS